MRAAGGVEQRCIGTKGRRGEGGPVSGLAWGGVCNLPEPSRSDPNLYPCPSWPYPGHGFVPVFLLAKI